MDQAQGTAIGEIIQQPDRVDQILRLQRAQPAGPPQDIRKRHVEELHIVASCQAQQVRVGLFAGVAQCVFFLIDQGEIGMAAGIAHAFQEKLDFARRTAAQTHDAGGLFAAFGKHRLRDMLLHHFHACLDAFGNVKADTVHQHFIDGVAAAFPVIDLVHDLEVARIAHRLGIGAIPYRPQTHFGRQHQFGDRFGGFMDFPVAHRGAGKLVAGLPDMAPFRHELGLASLESTGGIEDMLQLTCGFLVARQNGVMRTQQA